MKPADLYIVSHTELLITGTDTSCKTLGRGPSVTIKHGSDQSYFYKTINAIDQLHAPSDFE